MTEPPSDRAAVDEQPDSSLSDGIALSASAGLSAVAGMLTWVIAARLTDRATVGEVSAFVSAFLLVAGLTEFNLGVAILRWAPRAGRRTSAVVVRCLLVAGGACVVAAPIYLLVPGAEVILSAAGGGVVAAVLFVLATVGWGVLHLTDFAFVALRRPWWSVVRNLVLGACRIAAMVVLGVGVAAPELVLAWVGPVVACAVVFGAATAVLAARVGRSGRSTELPDRREVLRFLGPTWVGTLGLTVLYAQVPLVVTFRFGPDIGGGFFIVWQAITVIDVVATYFVSSLVGSVARDPARARSLSRTALRRLVILFLPALVVGALLAVPLLSIFGPEYTDQAGALRILLAAAAIRLVTLHFLGVRQAVGDAVGFARPHLAVAAATVLVLVLVPARTVDVTSVLAWAVLAVQAVTVLVLLGTQRARTAAAFRRIGGEPVG
jgi:O-antigen/teichoic acid export membrane protein